MVVSSKIKPSEDEDKTQGGLRGGVKTRPLNSKVSKSKAGYSLHMNVDPPFEGKEPSDLEAYRTLRQVDP